MGTPGIDDTKPVNDKQISRHEINSTIKGHQVPLANYKKMMSQIAM